MSSQVGGFGRVARARGAPQHLTCRRLPVAVRIDRDAVAAGDMGIVPVTVDRRRTISDVMVKPHSRGHGRHAETAASRQVAPSVSDYVTAFRSILPSLNESHLAMLRAHYMAPNRSLTASELTEAAVESERLAAARDVEDESELSEAVDEFGGESVLSETIGEDSDELAADAAEDTSLDAANLQYGSIGQALYEELPAFLRQQRKQTSGTVEYIGALAEAQDRSGPREAWVWKMRPEVASALEELGLTT